MKNIAPLLPTSSNGRMPWLSLSSLWNWVCQIRLVPWLACFRQDMKGTVGYCLLRVLGSHDWCSTSEMPTKLSRWHCSVILSKRSLKRHAVGWVGHYHCGTALIQYSTPQLHNKKNGCEEMHSLIWPRAVASASSCMFRWELTLKVAVVFTYLLEFPMTTILLEKLELSTQYGVSPRSSIPEATRLGDIFGVSLWRRLTDTAILIPLGQISGHRIVLPL
jgi:hypothetical protein